VDVWRKLWERLAATMKSDQRRKWARWSLAVSVLVLLAQNPTVGPTAIWQAGSAASGSAVVGSTIAGPGQELAATGRSLAVAYAPLSQSGWTATADSQETTAENAPASNAIDGKPSTYWHSQYVPSPPKPLPHWLTVDMKQPLRIAGVTYLPRQTSNSRNGDIGQFQIAVSSDNKTWSSPVAGGNWADDATLKTVNFAPITARYVRLTALTEAGNRGPWSNVAELNILAPVDPTFISRTGWTATADSQETAAEKAPASNAIDGNPATYWHSQYTPAPAVKLPHWIVINTNKDQRIAGLVYLPRPAAVANGDIGQYQISVSVNGTTWSPPVATGTFANDSFQKTVAFAPVTAQYVKLTALTESGNRGPWSNAAEINLLAPAEPPLVSRIGWTATADSQETGAENATATNAIDGNPVSYWHSQYTPAPAQALPHWLTINMHAAQWFKGLIYEPRSVASRNGNIGQYQITYSNDGTNWSAPIATGTFADDSSEKTVSFNPVQAQYVRLTALTEAGNRGPWTNVAEINLISAAAPTPTQGIWGPVIPLPLVAAAGAQLPNGQILTWSADMANSFSTPGTGKTLTAILDPTTGATTQFTVTDTNHEMFCPGTAMLPDGRLMVTGGANNQNTSIYDPATGQWSAGPNMEIGRGYQGMTTLPDGRAFVLGGSWSGTGPGNRFAEVWSQAGGWTELTGIDPTLIETADPQGEYRSDNHGWFFAWTGDRVFHAGPSKNMNWISTDGNGTITPAGTRADAADEMNGDAVMYDVGKILVVGGAPAYQNSDATSAAYTVDINQDTPTVTKLAPMANARAFANGVVLPDGEVLVLGGETHAVPFNDATSVLSAELWNPTTGKFTTMASESVPRNYHSIGLLLPDGRVFSAGGGMCGNCGTNHDDGQIYTPPYLLNPDGTPRPRPLITAAPASLALGSSLTVTTNGAVSSFAMIRMGATTHTVDNDQRRIPLTIAASAGTTYTLTTPSADPGVVLPGNYMLFAIDAAGTPSMAAIVNVPVPPAPAP
jgi:galactose oxidase